MSALRTVRDMEARLEDLERRVDALDGGKPEPEPAPAPAATSSSKRSRKVRRPRHRRGTQP